MGLNINTFGSLHCFTGNVNLNGYGILLVKYLQVLHRKMHTNSNAKTVMLQQNRIPRFE